MVRPDPETETLLRQFVCVRVVQMKGVDLREFQFDWDLTWAVVFKNADGAVYGRFGTRAGARGNQLTHVSLPAFHQAMERALEIHRGYPANRSQLAGKRGPAPEIRFAEQMPGLRKFASATTRENCIHCHMVGDEMLRLKLREKLTPADLWSYPLPENLGLRSDRDDGLRVAAVTPGSPAAQGGLAAGDRLVTLGGQPLISTADLQWVLHHQPTTAQLKVTYDRDGKTHEGTIPLEGGWREYVVNWRDSLWGIRPGLQLESMSRADKERRQIPPAEMALIVRYAFREAARAGLRTGDVITAVDGKTDLLTEGKFLEHVRLRPPAGGSARLSVLRREQKLEIDLPLR